MAEVTGLPCAAGMGPTDHHGQAHRQAITELLFFSSTGDLDGCKRIVAAWGIDVKDPGTSDYDKRSPLHLAAAEGCYSTITWLLGQGVSVNPIDRFKRTPLEDAVRSEHGRAEHGDVVNLLIQHGGKVIDKDGELAELHGSFIYEHRLSRSTTMSGIDPEQVVEALVQGCATHTGLSMVVVAGEFEGAPKSKDFGAVAIGDSLAALDVLQNLAGKRPMSRQSMLTSPSPGNACPWAAIPHCESEPCLTHQPRPSLKRGSTGAVSAQSMHPHGTEDVVPQRSPKQSRDSPGPGSGPGMFVHAPQSTRSAHSSELNEMWEIDHSHLVQGERIGKGSYGEVFKGEWRGTPVAIKKLLKDLEDLSARQLEDLVNELKHEAAILSRLRHPNVVLFMGAVIAPAQLSIVTAYMPRGSLFRLLGRRDLDIEPRRRLALARDIARGMHYLHSCEPMVVHRDLKSPNLLVDHDWSIKIGDFGMSSLKSAHFLTSRTAIGTAEWMAPEVLRNERCTEKCDVYSYAVILYELVTNERPWADCSPWQVMSLVGSQKQRLPIPDDIQPEAARLIQQCWAEDPTARPSFGDVLSCLGELKELKPSPSRMEVHHGASPRSG